MHCDVVSVCATISLKKTVVFAENNLQKFNFGGTGVSSM